MKRFLFLFSFVFLLFSCTDEPSVGKPVMTPSAALKNVMSFLQYRQQHVKLYEDFTPLDKGARIIPRELFFRYLSTGRFLPLRLKHQNEKPAYQLYKMDNAVDPELRQVIKDWGKEEYAYFKTEGMEIPDFDFVDLEGNRYTKESIKGKTVVLKCWFVNCLPCRQEMPALNALKRSFAHRKDVLFLSLCLDPKKEVEDFLKTTAFDYAVVPDQTKFMTEDLGLNAYPTHFVINKNGVIVKKVTDHKAMEAVLHKEASR